VPKNGKIKMVIYDLMGREVRTLMNHDLAAGYHTLTWDGKNNIGQIASAGLYFCQLRGQNYTKTIKMLLLK
jgi:flagellar hook assembly protein FlgD